MILEGVRRSSMRNALRCILKYAAIITAIVVVGLGAEYLSGLLPQERILLHYQESVKQLDDEGFRPMILNRYRADGMLNNLTETLILHYSVFMNTRKDPASVLTNPSVLPKEAGEPSAYYESAASNDEINNHYLQYWLGSRALVRTLMYLFDYGEMRRILMWAFFLLMVGCALRIYQRTQQYGACLVFTVSILVMNPIVVSTSFQYGCCYLIAMLGTFAVTVWKREDSMLFILLGAMTQFFDFYTAPSLTLIYPLATLLLLTADEKPKIAMRRVGRGIAAWLIAYVGMWLIKLCLTNILTDQDAIQRGFSSLVNRLGGDERFTEGYGALDAYRACFAVVGGTQWALIGAVFIISCLWEARRGCSLPMAGITLSLACIPLIWIAIAAQPTVLHDYFQYRTLGGAILTALYAPIVGARAWRGKPQSK